MVNSLCSGIVESQDLIEVGKPEDRERTEEMDPSKAHLQTSSVFYCLPLPGSPMTNPSMDRSIVWVRAPMI